MIATRKQLLLTVLTSVFAMIGTALADPIDGRDTLKFSQQPMHGTPLVGPNGNTELFWGHDELSTAYSVTTATGQTPYQGVFMADDFADKFSTPVVHVKWWGSYLNNFQNPNIPVNKFLISFESDVPAGRGDVNFSRPGEPLLNQIVRRGPLAPGSGTFTETLIPGPANQEALYEYNAELHLGKEFFQKPDEVYWLKIVALVDLPPGTPLPSPIEPPTFAPRWGWHNRDYTIQDTLASTPPAVTPGEAQVGSIGPPAASSPIWHFQDDAVTGRILVDVAGPMGQIMPVISQGEYQPRRYIAGLDGPPPIAEFSKDLAFELYTVPEPAACLLLVCGCLGLALVRGDRR